MATYKAEFLAHYYEAHRRPRSAYAFGWIQRWAALAEIAPRLVNFTTQTPLVREIAKLVAGMPIARNIPAFAPQSFRQWFLARFPASHSGAPRVILWPDTFNDHFHPDTLVSAVEVLESAGFLVEIPRARLCCGRPLYDYGLLDRARAHLETIMDRLGAEIDAGIPVVVLEPSCAAVFKDELRNLFPDSDRAHRLSEQVFSLGAFLTEHPDRMPPLKLERAALLHGHCHQKALGGIRGEVAVLERLGVRCEPLDSGCCGMAGSFGFERDHYAVSMAVGERVLLPAVRRASAATLIVADGFSCREQISQATDRRALHLADVVHMAMAEGPGGPAGDCPERSYVPSYQHEVAMSGRTALTAAGVLAAAVLLARARWTGR